MNGKLAPETRIESKNCSIYTADFSEIHMHDVARVGGKNASLGELFSQLKPQGVGILDGFAITTDAYWKLMEEQDLRGRIAKLFSDLDPENLQQLAAKGHEARTQILQTPLPGVLQSEIRDAYARLIKRIGRESEMAVKVFRKRRGFAGSVLCRSRGVIS